MCVLHLQQFVSQAIFEIWNLKFKTNPHEYPKTKKTVKPTIQTNEFSNLVFEFKTQNPIQLLFHIYGTYFYVNRDFESNEFHERHSILSFICFEIQNGKK